MILGKNCRGQLTVFFAVTLVMLLTIMAFIVNVGMYVKAKINLQNAVDAAAFSGAAVQARQLSDIAYLNWEMRNVFKEWMFKYYVLGNLSLPQVNTVSVSPDPMNFNMAAFNANSPSDPYNIPSICLDFGTDSNICKIYYVPGLPRFQPTGFIGTDQTSQAFLDVIGQQKSKDCANRSQINFSAALNWAYAAAPVNLQGVPTFAANRPGAFTKAIQLAMRIRNLERLVNEAPVTVCTQSGSGCQYDYYGFLQNGNGTNAGPHKERTSKAFWSALRNLGNPDSNNEMAATFKLTEIAPSIANSVNQKDAKDLSYLLIPDAKLQTFQKHYVDLKLYLINYATFYTMFVPKADNQGVPIEGACEATKLALPVPGYPLGYEKNPNLMTYYAVKGEVEFVGLLNPFRSHLPKLTAYAAAKPFGGRIGPKLFQTPDNDRHIIKFRPENSRSAHYAIGANLESRGGGAYTPGDAIPFNTGTKFWISDPNATEAIGGWTEKETLFVIPNLVYEYKSGQMPQLASSAPAQVIAKNGQVFDGASGGLFDRTQFQALRSNLIATGTNGGWTMDDVTRAIENVTAPTKYDAYNYLIPTDIQSDIDSFQIVSPSPSQGVDGKLQEYKIYAPLIGGGTHFLYESVNDVASTIAQFILTNEEAVGTYLDSLKGVGDAILASAAANSPNISIYQEASSKFYNLTGGKLTCGSVAGDFAAFYFGGINKTSVKTTPIEEFKDNNNCPTSLFDNITDYLSTMTQDQNFHLGVFKYNDDSQNIGFSDHTDFLTAFMPGPRQGAQQNGMVNHPFRNEAPVSARRNFYSTKFISLKSVDRGSGAEHHYYSGQSPRYIEGVTQLSSLTGPLLNPIELDDNNIQN
jgi:hypothetical protein